MPKGIFSFFLILIASASIFGQSPDADFSLQLTACLGENVKLVNNSSNSTLYQWDFCQGDLSLNPFALTLTTLNGDVTTGIDVVFDGSAWYGFVTNQNANSILRLDFGSDIKSIPTIVDLGNIGGNINRPTDIKVVQENGVWYGFVYGLNEPFISRINFGSSLANIPDSPTPITTDVILSGSGTANGGFDIMRNGGSWVIVATVNSTVSVIQLTSIESIPTMADVMEGIANPYGNSLGDVVLVKFNGNYFGYVVAFGNRTLQRLSFGNSLFNQPTFDDVAVPILSDFSPYGIDIGFDNGFYTLVISTLEGSLLRINLGNTPASSIISGNSLGNLSVLENTLKIKMLKNKSDWFAFTPSWNSTKLFKIQFPSPACEVGLSDVINDTGPVVSFTSAGLKTVTLRAFNSKGEYSEVSKQLNVLNSIAPDVNIERYGNCLGNPTSFSAISSGNILSYDWDFGDSHVMSGQQVNHQYVSTGGYNVALRVATNNCQNFKEINVPIYNPPVSNFSLPSPALSCTNQNYTFTNATSSDVGAPTTWQWNVNGVNVSTAKDLVQLFSTTTSNQIDLIASIPGCSSTKTQNFVIQAQGPLVNFSSSGICQSGSTQFTNLTSGTDATYAWTFGDGNTSVQTNPTNSYQNIGDFNISLTASNIVGCRNSKSKTITIYSKPSPDFSLSLPPFSCTGSQSQFNDLTPALTDSNISSWLWSFGDTQNGTSTIQNAQYTYTTAGQYNVSLITTTDFGCSATTQKQVTIQQSPIVAFTNSAACLNQGVSFVDASSGSIKSRLWKIGSNTYTTATASQTFTGTGNYQAQLSVTGNNNCIASLTKTIVVPVPPTLDFSIQNNCSGQNAVFTDTAPVAVDPVTSRTWDFASQGTATGSPVQHLFSSTGTYAVKMAATTQSGCIYPLTKNVVITKTPTANFTASIQTGPPPLAVQFSNTSVNATSYAWQFGDATNSTSTDLSPSYTFNTIGDYLVKLTATSLQGCKDIFSKDINVILPLPDLAIDGVSVVRNDASGTIKMSIALHNKGNSIITGSALLVDVSGLSLLKETVATAIQPGQTLVYVTNAEVVLRGDAIKYICAEINASDDRDLSNNKECTLVQQDMVYFSPYPNPTTDGQLHLDWITAQGSNADVLIVNSFGQKVYSKELSASRVGLNQLEFDVSKLSAGVYIIIFQIDGVKKSFRFNVL